MVSGVTHGGVLGPVLFFVSNREMFKVLDNTLMRYTDESTLLASIRTPSERLPVAFINWDMDRFSN